MASAVSVRLIPSGVISNIHARTSAIGKPMMMSRTIDRMTQVGTSNTGKTWAIP
jgi:hypothetical protein